MGDITLTDVQEAIQQALRQERLSFVSLIRTIKVENQSHFNDDAPMDSGIPDLDSFKCQLANLLESEDKHFVLTVTRSVPVGRGKYKEETKESSMIARTKEHAEQMFYDQMGHIWYVLRVEEQPRSE